jgi:hypothetical protein
MKRLIAALLMFVTLTASAEPFKLGFKRTETDTFVEYNKEDWDIVGNKDGWNLHLARGKTGTINGLVILHTMVTYDEPVKNDFSDDMIHKIFNFGLVDCDGKRIFLLTDFFTDENHKVIWISKYEFGEFVSDVAPGTPRNKVYKLLCEGKDI